MIENVETLDDPRLDAFARLTEAQLRSKLEPEKALFIAESGKVIERALAAGMEPLSLLMEAKWLPAMQPIIDEISARWGDGVPVLVTPACYDPLYRRAVRVSMGTVFQVPWTRIGEEAGAGATGTGGWAPDGVPLLHELGFKTAAFALTDDSVPLDDPALNAEERLALVFGTEGDGLAHDTIARCDYTVRIPMAHGVDSLNVAAASAVAFWETRSTPCRQGGRCGSPSWPTGAP